MVRTQKTYNRKSKFNVNASGYILLHMNGAVLYEGYLFQVKSIIIFLNLKNRRQLISHKRYLQKFCSEYQRVSHATLHLMVSKFLPEATWSQNLRW